MASRSIRATPFPSISPRLSGLAYRPSIAARLRRSGRCSVCPRSHHGQKQSRFRRASRSSINYPAQGSWTRHCNTRSRTIDSRVTRSRLFGRLRASRRRFSSRRREHIRRGTESILFYSVPKLRLGCLYQAARRFKPLSAIAVSFLSVSFSSSSVCWSKEMQSLRPSCFAHAISVP